MVIVRSLLAMLAAPLGVLLTAPVIVLGLPFWIVAVTTRALARLLEPRYSPGPAFVEFDPIVGWKPKANVDAYHLVDGDVDVFHVTTDSQGWRESASVAESQVVVFGDSFAWGYGIDDEHFFANLLPHVRVKTIGVMGYSMVQEFMWLQRLASQLRGKLVVWLIYFGNDLFENLMPHRHGYRMPFLRQVGEPETWEVVTSHISPSKWFHTTRTDGRLYYQKLAEYCTPPSQARRGYSACEFLLRSGQKVCSEVGAQLVVVTIPERTQLSAEGHAALLKHGGDRETFDPDLPDDTIRGICERLAIPFVAGMTHLELGHYKQFDAHWNERGHRRVAQVLSDLYADYVAGRLGRVGG